MEKAAIKGELAELAEHIAAIMGNPLTPVVLYNVLADVLTDWTQLPSFGDAAVILTVLQGQIGM